MVKYTYDRKAKCCVITVSNSEVYATVTINVTQRKLFNTIKLIRRSLKVEPPSSNDYIKAIKHLRLLSRKHNADWGFEFSKGLVDELRHMEAWNLYALREFGFTF